jgi:two-component system chemotaxis sensor kinase CheA
MNEAPPDNPSAFHAIPATVREQVDSISTRILLDGVEDAAWLAAALPNVHEQASSAGLVKAAEAAADLIAETGFPDGPRLEEITAGLTRLQAALAEPEGEAAMSSNNPLPADAELVADFVCEANEHLTSIEAQMLVLEKQPGDAEAIHSAFRSFHTIKGVAGFLDLPEIQQVAHETETLLDLARNGSLSITPEIVDVILHAADYVRQCTRALEAGPGAQATLPAPGTLIGCIQQAASCRPFESPSGLCTEPKPASSPVQQKACGTLKVDTAKLDYLVDMVGEMVIAQSLVRHDPALAEMRNSRLARNLVQLSRMTSDVQRMAMAMRMVPIGQLFRRVERLVRDLSRKSGKQVKLELSGDETELDRTIVEDLADPLLHMVRNAVDHGIEPAEVRRAAGKPSQGTVTLRARHQAGNILIEISDDGRGLDRGKILHKARERGLVDPSRDLPDNEIFQLIFQPGFTTAESVTDVSGRGVGMDVVRRRLERMRGRLEMQSKPGHGARFSISLPLTLAIIDGLVVGVGAERYIVPIFAVRETLRPSQETVSTVENTHEVALVRDKLLPIVRLARRFGVQAKSERPADGVLIISESEGRTFALLVDELVGKQEVVIKGLGEHLGNLPGVSGAAILGDGRVGLILDLPGLYRASNHG